MTIVRYSQQIFSILFLCLFLANLHSVIAETKPIDCASNSDCGTTQVCDRTTYTCEDVSPGQVIPDNRENTSNGENNELIIPAIIVAIAIIIGFLILAIILSRKNK